MKRLILGVVAAIAAFASQAEQYEVIATLEYQSVCLGGLPHDGERKVWLDQNCNVVQFWPKGTTQADKNAIKTYNMN